MTSPKGIPEGKGASYHRSSGFSPLGWPSGEAPLSLFFPTPNTFDQQPRFFFGVSAVLGGGGGGSGATPVVAAVCGGMPVSSMCGGAGFSSFLNAEAIVPKMLCVVWRSQVVVGCVPRTKYSV